MQEERRKKEEGRYEAMRLLLPSGLKGVDVCFQAEDLTMFCFHRHSFRKKKEDSGKRKEVASLFLAKRSS